MKASKLAWKNLWYRPMPTILSLLLFALGTGLAAFLLLFNHQVEEKFEANLADIDLVVGAKGSPLQLILCNMYHIDVPTGNIPLKQAKPFLNPAHPLIEEALPLSLGDSYKGFRIVGTTDAFFDFYGVEIGEGETWLDDFHVVIGHNVARVLNLELGDTFFSAHGLADDDMHTHDDIPPLTVKGILAASGTVADQLILCTTPTVWKAHGHPMGGDVEGDDHDHEDHDHEGQDHGDHDHVAQDVGGASGEKVSPGSLDRLLDNEGEEITSLLLRFKGRNFQALNMQRNINENTDLQAATPAIEIARLYTLMGVGEEMIRMLAIAILIVSALSVFLLLLHSLRSRKYELALMRVMGGRPGELFRMILWEGLSISAVGCLLGILLAHVSLGFLAETLEASYRYPFTGWLFLPEELYLFLGAIVIGAIAAAIPALQAQRTNISATLAGD